MSLPIGNEIDLSEQLNELNTRIEKEKLRGSGFIFNRIIILIIISVSLHLGLY